MIVYIYDYDGTPKAVEVPDDTKELRGIVLSGDMVLQSPVHADSSDDRRMDFFDGEFSIEGMK